MVLRFSDEITGRRIARGSIKPAISVPEWVAALEIGEWYEIPNTNLSSVDPSPTPSGTTGPSAKIITWTSMVADPINSLVYQVAGGGHADYAGNEVDVLTLNTETPAWSQVLAPTSNANIANAEYYNDGRPCSRHHYYGIVWNEFDNRVMLFSGSRWQTGGFTNAVDSYNIGSNSYSAEGTHPDIPAPLSGQIVSVGGLPSVTMDPSTGDVYLSVNNESAVWRRSSNTWDDLANDGPVGFQSCSSWDTTRDRGFVLSNNDSDIFEPGSGWSGVTLTGANAGDVDTQQQGMFYVPSLDAYLVRLSGSGGTVYQLSASDFVATTFSTTGGGSIPAVTNGVFNKFVYLPLLGGAVLVPEHDGNSWFLRIHQ